MSSSEIFITKRDGKRERFSIDKIRAAIAKAFYIARSGRPGPVVVDITKDAQCATAPFRYERITSIRSYAPTLTPDARRIEEAARLIDEARRPLAMIGQGAILGNAEAELRAFLDRSGMPAASTLLGLSALPSDDPRNVGMLGMHGNYGPNIKNKECDLLVAVGMRFDDRVTGDPAAFGPNARIIHLEIDPSEIDKIVHADVPLVGDVKRTLPLLTERIRPRDHSAWIEEFRACDRIEYERVVRRAIRPDGGRIRMGEAVDAVARAYDRDAVMVTDVGQQQMFAARYFGFRRSRSVVTSGGLGTMGFGLPAAIGAKLGAPDREVVLFAGDGGLQMTIQELATIFQSHVCVKIVLLNNSFLGMVRQWQELFYDRRYSFTEMINPDFGLIARGNGISYRLVERREELAHNDARHADRRRDERLVGLILAVIAHAAHRDDRHDHHAEHKHGAEHLRDVRAGADGHNLIIEEAVKRKQRRHDDIADRGSEVRSHLSFEYCSHFSASSFVSASSGSDASVFSGSVYTSTSGSAGAAWEASPLVSCRKTSSSVRSVFLKASSGQPLRVSSANRLRRRS